MIFLDTDHTTFLKYPDSERGRRIIDRPNAVSASEVIGVAIVTVEERLRGWLAVIAKEKSALRQVVGYGELALLGGLTPGKWGTRISHFLGAKFSPTRTDRSGWTTSFPDCLTASRKTCPRREGPIAFVGGRPPWSRRCSCPKLANEPWNKGQSGTRLGLKRRPRQPIFAGSGGGIGWPAGKIMKSECRSIRGRSPMASNASASSVRCRDSSASPCSPGLVERAHAEPLARDVLHLDVGTQNG